MTIKPGDHVHHAIMGYGVVMKPHPGCIHCGEYIAVKLKGRRMGHEEYGTRVCGYYHANIEFLRPVTIGEELAGRA